MFYKHVEVTTRISLLIREVIVTFNFNMDCSQKRNDSNIGFPITLDCIFVLRNNLNLPLVKRAGTGKVNSNNNTIINVYVCVCRERARGPRRVDTHRFLHAHTPVLAAHKEGRDMSRFPNTPNFTAADRVEHLSG